VTNPAHVREQKGRRHFQHPGHREHREEVGVARGRHWCNHVRPRCLPPRIYLCARCVRCVNLPSPSADGCQTTKFPPIGAFCARGRDCRGHGHRVRARIGRPRGRERSFRARVGHSRDRERSFRARVGHSCGRVGRSRGRLGRSRGRKNDQDGRKMRPAVRLRHATTRITRATARSRHSLARRVTGTPLPAFLCSPLRALRDRLSSH
jgi:hypothetical protein